MMSIFRRSSPGRPALVPSIVEALSLGDGIRDKVLLVGSLTLRKLAAMGLPTDPGRHEITISTKGLTYTIDVWAAEQGPLREILARDDYGVMSGRTVPRGATVVDVGANVGIFAVAAGRAAGPSGRVLAFEPHPAAYSRLVRNVHANGLQGVVATHNRAISSASGLLRFSPAPNSVENVMSGEGTMSIEAGTLDDNPDLESASQIDLIKIDVEGHEVQVLMGAARTLAKTKAVILEYHTDRNRSDALELLADSGLRLVDETRLSEGLGLISARRN